MGFLKCRISVVIVVLLISLIANCNSFSFRHITIEQGLSNSNVNCFAQDSLGFIWIGTENGLNRFDGYSFTQYFSDVNKPGTLNSNEILCMTIDSKENLWIGTFHGLMLYDRFSDSFTKIAFDSIDLLNANIPVYSIYEDRNGNIWVGTDGNGLIKLDQKHNLQKCYYNQPRNSKSLSSNNILFINGDDNGNLWIGTTNNGLDCFDVSNEIFRNYKPIETENPQINVNAILELFRLNDSTFLTGTRGDGIFTFDIRTRKFQHFSIKCKDYIEEVTPYEVYEITRDSKGNLWVSVHGKGLFCKPLNSEFFHLIESNSSDNSSLINNNIRQVMEDRQGNLWVASFQGGVNFLSNRVSNFKSYNLDNPSSSYKSRTVAAIETDSNGNIWVGTDGVGLKYINKATGKVDHFYPGNNSSKSVPGKVIMSLLLDGDNLWMGSYLGGVSRMNTKTGTFKNYKVTDAPGSISENFITALHMARNGVLWVGTIGGGLCRYNRETDDFKVFYAESGDLVSNFINTITEDNNGRLWIGTFWGLSVFDPLNGIFIDYLRNEDGGSGLSSNTIYDIHFSAKNEIWLGTRNGLNKFLPGSNKFESINLSDGLPGNVIYGIEEDSTGNLWLSTNNGLCHYDPEINTVRNYFSSDGLLSNEFFRHASHRSSDGRLFFGGINGLNSFDPKKMQENYSIPTPVITRFRVFNQPVNPGDTLDNQLLLNKPVYLTDTIVLKHKFNSFSFEFAAMDFMHPNKNMYRCMLEGFDMNWRELDSKQRFVTYTNLDAGEYIFRLKASSIENKWGNTEKTILLIVKPPMYKTWWAYTSYYIFIVFALIIIWRLTIRRIHARNQIRLERIEHDKLKEINQAKLQFFTNISHEFRTPITLILGPLGKMLNDKSLAKKYGESIGLMIKNSNRLLRLVNQLMDFRKIELGKMRLKTEKADIIEFLRDIYDNFQQLASNKSIDFKFVSDFECRHLWFDPDKVDKIVFNLLSNAFKFTPEYGEISVRVCEAELDGQQWLRLSVKDSGKGIPLNEQPKVFERFFQTNDPSQAVVAGSGVGLSLTRSLVEQHYGEIHLNSKEGQGAEFVVLLPINENVYSEEEKFAVEESGVKKYLHSEPIIDKDEQVHTVSSEKDCSILVVEDNVELRRYILDEFSDFYNVYEAENGKEGFDLALEKVPDLIISDVLMPVMDGLELCQKVKANFLTNHIPVILLTARASIEHRIKGLEQGADSYIPKPFNLDHLRVRIKKLLELRIVLKQKYTRELNPDEAGSVIQEDMYLKQVNEYVLNNIDDLGLNIERICSDLGISRTHFYRKIKLMTGKSPTEYVRFIRLNEAAKMLSTNADLTASEVGYRVGFNSPSYFSVSFKEQFNITPAEFSKRSKES